MQSKLERNLLTSASTVQMLRLWVPTIMHNSLTSASAVQMLRLWAPTIMHNLLTSASAVQMLRLWAPTIMHNSDFFVLAHPLSLLLKAGAGADSPTNNKALITSTVPLATDGKSFNSGKLRKGKERWALDGTPVHSSSTPWTLAECARPHRLREPRKRQTPPTQGPKALEARKPSAEGHHELLSPCHFQQGGNTHSTF